MVRLCRNLSNLFHCRLQESTKTFKVWKLCYHFPSKVCDFRSINSRLWRFLVFSANYVNRTCNDRLKHCVEQFQDANLTQFNGSTCSARDLEDVIITSMNIATLGTSPGSLSQLTNLQWATALVFSLSVVLFIDNWWYISCTLSLQSC